MSDNEHLNRCFCFFNSTILTYSGFCMVTSAAPEAEATPDAQELVEEDDI